MQIGIIADLAIAPRPPPEFHVDSWSPRRPGCGPETGFEEIGALTTVNNITLPRSGLLASVVESPSGEHNFLLARYS